MVKFFLHTIVILFCTGAYAQEYLSKNDFVYTQDLRHFDVDNISRNYKPQFIYRNGVRLFNTIIGRQLEVVAYIAVNESGEPVISNEEIEEKIETLNDVFRNNKLRFYICDYKVMEDPLYADVQDSKDCNTIDLMMRDYYSENRINLYFVNSIYTTFGNTSNLVMMPDTLNTNDYIILANKESDHVLIHSFGHFFGLYHTHENNLFGAEPVMPSADKQYSTGDLIFDTPAEIDLSETGLVGEDCEYSGISQSGEKPQAEADEFGNIHVPSVTNYMSHIPEQCAILFTDEQLYRVRTIYLNFYTYLR